MAKITIVISLTSIDIGNVIIIQNKINVNTWGEF
jgi:hypothetical protein